MAKDYILEKRKFVIGGIAISIVLIYLIRVRLKNVLKEMNVQTVTQMVQPT